MRSECPCLMICHLIFWSVSFQHSASDRRGENCEECRRDCEVTRIFNLHLELRSIKVELYLHSPIRLNDVVLN
jgi:hypothetical protein